MDVAVVHVIKGIEDRPTIRIWGDNGALCRPGVNSFPARTRWLLAVSPLPETPTGDPSVRPGFGSPPGRTEYAISICGDFWLEVRGDRAIGRIAVAEHGARMESAPLPDVLAWIRSGGATPLPPHAPVR
jgi:hypothetical protein